MIKLIKKYEGLVVILALVVVLRLPSLYEPAWYGDENIYLAIGQGVSKGLVLYQDITDFPNKPPMIYLMAAVFGNVFWFRLVLMIWNGVNVAIMYFFLRMLFKGQRWIWNGFTLLFVLLTCLPFWEGNIANAEIFWIMPVTAGFLLLWKLKKTSNKMQVIRLATAAGVVLGVAFLFKIPVVMDIGAAILVFFVFWHKKLIDVVKKTFLRREIYLVGLGLVVPVGLAIGFHLLQGVSPVDLINIAVGSAGYVSVWQEQTGIMAYLGFGSLYSRAVLMVLVVSGIYLVRKRLSKEMIMASVWLVMALFGALISGRPYPHYLLQMVPAMVLVLAILVSKKITRAGIGVAMVLALIGVGAYIRFDFYRYPVVAYYKNFWESVTGKIDEYEYYNRFDSRMERNYKVASYLKTRTNESDKIYIWGTEPGIYVLSDRLMVGRLVTSFHVEDLNEYEALGKEIAKKLPKYIVIMQSEYRDFGQLESLVDASYVLVKEIKEAMIYRKME